MKKVKPGGRRSMRAASRVPKNIDEYVARAPEAARNSLNTMRTAIRSALPPNAIETISYRIPAFKYKQVLVWFAAFSDHCSFFPTASIVEAFKSELRGFPTSKGTIRFPIDKPLPTALIKKLVQARLAQIENKKCNGT
jgi:uncharacterized protein YdhG (YjbR/CyaY superfamily)